jgi:hypothetical protein
MNAAVLLERSNDEFPFWDMSKHQQIKQKVEATRKTLMADISDLQRDFTNTKIAGAIQGRSSYTRFVYEHTLDYTCQTLQLLGAFEYTRKPTTMTEAQTRKQMQKLAKRVHDIGSTWKTRYEMMSTRFPRHVAAEYADDGTSKCTNGWRHAVRVAECAVVLVKIMESIFRNMGNDVNIFGSFVCERFDALEKLYDLICPVSLDMFRDSFRAFATTIQYTVSQIVGERCLICWCFDMSQNGNSSLLRSNSTAAFIFVVYVVCGCVCMCIVKYIN